MAKSTAQRVKEYRERRKLNPLLVEEDRKKDRERKSKLRLELTNTGRIEKLRKYERLQKKKQKLRRQKEQQQKAVVINKMSPSSLGKATSRVKRALPHSPSKTVQVIGKLVTSLSPKKKSMVLNIVNEGQHFKQLKPARKKRSDAVSEDTAKSVKAFFMRDDISWQCPGRKDVKSIKTENGREHRQKRLLLVNLHEAYSIFCKDYAIPPLKLSKFKELKPKEVVPMNLNDQETCVCVYHANAELLLYSLNKIVPDLSKSLTEVIQNTVCSLENQTCIDRLCSQCGVNKLDTYFEELCPGLDVVYYKWRTENGCTVKSEVTGTLFEAKEDFYGQLQDISRHAYNAKRQHYELRQLKENLSANEIIVLQDFAENYTIRHQSEIMQAHWNSPNVTLFTCIVYYKDVEGELTHLNYCIVSDFMQHNKEAVHVFNETLLKELFSQKLTFKVSHVHYFTDGASSQFKNRFILKDLMFHKEDYGCTAERNYFGTAHGKGPHDGIGGEVKRVVFRAELQKKIYVNSAEEFADAAALLAPSVNIIYVPKTIIHEENVTKLQARWESCVNIPGIRNYHCALLNDEDSLLLLKNSCFSCKESEGQIFKITAKQSLPFDHSQLVENEFYEEVNSRAECTQNISEDTYVLATFSSQNQCSHYRYLCIVQEVLENDEYKVVGLKCLDTKQTVFKCNENDVSVISKSDIVSIVPKPQIMGTERVRYHFNIPVDIKEA